MIFLVPLEIRAGQFPAPPHVHVVLEVGYLYSPRNLVTRGTFDIFPVRFAFSLREQVNDFHLLNLAVTHGARLATFDQAMVSYLDASHPGLVELVAIS